MSNNPRASQPPTQNLNLLIFSTSKTKENNNNNSPTSWRSSPTEKWGPDEIDHYDYDSESEYDYSHFETPRKTSNFHLSLSFPSPRARRQTLLVVVTLLLLWTAVTRLLQPWVENMIDAVAVDASVESEVTGNFSTHVPVDFTGMVLVQDLREEFVPVTGEEKKKHQKHGRKENGRLIIVGDVHGMKESLIKLLDKLDFDKERDHLVLAGDMISKGPDSVGVLEYVMELGATAVRGNHEDRVVLAYDGLHSGISHGLGVVLPSDTEPRSFQPSRSKTRDGEQKDRELAAQLKHRHIQWLKSCPVILRVGQIAGMGEVVVVHAGLVPAVPLERQDPFFAMNMRTIDLETGVPSESRDGTSWTKFWNRHQERLPKEKRSTVVYGHDSKRGLNVMEFSKGIDTGCLKGGRLTALVIEGGVEARQRLVHVKCHDGRP